MKNTHEIRDPIHIFIKMNSLEREVIDSRPFQRLRYIHQLAMTYLVYPGATHRRFEHSLGVMELATRVFDIITKKENIQDAVRNLVPNDDRLLYWQRVLRMAALCHDLGHLPFSHAAEADLLPEGWDHERLTVDIIMGEELRQIWAKMNIDAEDVAKLAVGPKKWHKYRPGSSINTWEAIMAEIIVGDAFGVDRIDYLLRDSHHAGVAYGRFDHYRLVDTLRILPKTQKEGSQEPALGIEEGGLHSAEALLLARYFMYTQLYFHSVRRIYDLHLQDFMKAILPKGFPTDVSEHLKWTDNEVTAKILESARDNGHLAHDSARRIVEREHYKLLYTRNEEDVSKNPEAAEHIYRATCKKYGNNAVRMDSYKDKGNPTDFPVLTVDQRILSSLTMSSVLKNVPIVAVDYVFVRPDIAQKAKMWLTKNRDVVIEPRREQ